MNKGDKIEPGEELYPRVYRGDKRYIDRRTGIPTSRAFAPRPKDNGKLSVNLAKLTTIEQTIVDKNKFCIYSIFSDLVYKLGLNCLYDPIEEQNNFAHSIIIGFKENDESIPGILARSSKRIA